VPVALHFTRGAAGPRACAYHRRAAEKALAAYANHGNLFLARFPYLEGAQYEDFGVNFETFTNEAMLEIEALGPKVQVEPGDYASFKETWYLLGNVAVPDGDKECGEWLAKIAADRPL
jgi:hypothetical protein